MCCGHIFGGQGGHRDVWLKALPSLLHVSRDGETWLHCIDGLVINTIEFFRGDSCCRRIDDDLPVCPISQLRTGRKRDNSGLYGECEAHIREEAVKFGVMDRVVLHGGISRTDALSAVRGANVTVVITSVFAEDTEKDKGIVPGKLF